MIDLASQLFELGPFIFTTAHAFVIAGAILVINEAFVPGANSIVFGIGLLVSGLIGMATGLGMQANDSDLFVLSLMALVAGVAFYLVYRRILARPDDSGHTTTDSSDLKGKTGTVLETVTADSGRVRIRGIGSNPEYQARTDDGEIPPDTTVTVLDPGGGSVLFVEPATEES